jgi:hypothetical protein
MIEPHDNIGNLEPVSGVIADDLHCRSCGYNLRGLSDSGRCPECDAPIDRSSHGDLLHYSDPRWLWTVARGFRILNFSIALGLLALIGIVIFGRVAGLRWVMPASILMVGTVMAVGIWLATEREPAAADQEPVLSSRRLVRSLVLAAILLQAGGIAIASWSRSSSASVRLAALAMIIGGLICGFRYAASLGRRIPDSLLVAQTRGIIWGLIISYGLSLLIAALTVAPRPMPPAMSMLFGLSCTAIIMCVIFSLWTLTLLGRYSVLLQEVARDAELETAIEADMPER